MVESFAKAERGAKRRRGRRDRGGIESFMIADRRCSVRRSGRFEWRLKWSMKEDTQVYIQSVSTSDPNIVTTWKLVSTTSNEMTSTHTIVEA